jgi:hypothetical protein
VTTYSDALKEQIHAHCAMPEGGLVVEVDYVTAVRVRILDAQGNQHVVHTAFHSPTLDACTEEGLLRRALRRAEDRNG